ncbi:hypothetical protein A3A66_04230 [Microgenomates group bacterium RIFCSPLOWO2_01_FULL_46_13]|nr:MAG: hypothetical protein A2783_00060 [Microgenomates group bacterium RIFCSPHIGHO2_01_FULL_45_11]OGV94187.1 MAG: hypothetical protein A3A66_04230 [Microgenomates group bacterium RIFCSPLOWO2_01_FULL_46_13]
MTIDVEKFEGMPWFYVDRAIAQLDDNLPDNMIVEATFSRVEGLLGGEQRDLNLDNPYLLAQRLAGGDLRQQLQDQRFPSSSEALISSILNLALTLYQTDPKR